MRGYCHSQHNRVNRNGLSHCGGSKNVSLICRCLSGIHGGAAKKGRLHDTGGVDAPIRLIFAPHVRVRSSPCGYEVAMATVLTRESRQHTPPRSAFRLALGPGEVSGALLIFVSWVALFAAGMLVDTRPYREQISPSAGTDVNSAPVGSQPTLPERAPSRVSPPPTESSEPASVVSVSSPPVSVVRPQKLSVWSLLVVLFCYLPLNLAWVCAAASALGAFGEQANLACMPPSRRAQTNQNPYLASVLRGFFVYLFLLSGLLLLDDTPFVNPNQGQYVRLSGFLSLSSFVVSYQPKLFNVLIVWAFHRIQAKEGDDPTHEEIAKHARRVSHAEVTHAVYNVDERLEVPRANGLTVGGDIPRAEPPETDAGAPNGARSR
jgi:hypothetical protein